jgi:hypothetical protein
MPAGNMPHTCIVCWASRSAWPTVLHVAHATAGKGPKSCSKLGGSTSVYCAFSSLRPGMVMDRWAGP